MKPEYHEGPTARNSFEDGMRKLFRIPKPEAVKPKPPTKTPKQK